MSTAKRFLGTRPSSPRCPHSLQIERLEQRLVMSGVQAADALSNALVTHPLANEASTIIASVQDVHGDAAHSAAVAGFDRFKSFGEIKEFLLSEAIEYYKGTFGQAYIPWSYVWFNGGNVPGFTNFNMELADTTHVLLSTTTYTSVNYSGTNTQVAGVDEADLMETDGKYLYMISSGELAIVDIRSTDHPKIACRLQLDRGVSSMYLSGDRLTLISQPNLNFYLSTTPSNFEITVLDISQRTQPKVVQRTLMEGSLVDSRAIGDKVYLVINNNQMPPAPQVVNMDGTPVEGYTYDPNAQYRYETEQEYRSRTTEYFDKCALPLFASYDAKGKQISTGFISDPKRVFKAGESDDSHNMTTVAVIDMHSRQYDPADAISLFGCNASQIYASKNNLYLFSKNYNSNGQFTDIRKIDLAGPNGRLEFTAKGTVNGYMLDQFSADEYNGFLRIATTGNMWEEQFNTQNYLFVLKQTGNTLTIAGSIEDLSPNEQIYSVRFLGDQAYVVTFRRFDPLFAIDLRDPTAPEVKGQLDIPGFSNYLQSIDGGLLIGFGRDADPVSGWYQDPQISLFDVSDLSNPQLLDRFTLDNGCQWISNLFSDHHAVAYYPDSHILTVSVPDMRNMGPDSWLYGVNDFYVFRVDTSETSADLELLGKIEHDDSVLRSVEIDNKLISISNDSIEVHNINDPQLIYATLSLNENNDTHPITLPPLPGIPRPIIAEPIIPSPIFSPIYVISPILFDPISVEIGYLPEIIPAKSLSITTDLAAANKPETDITLGQLDVKKFDIPSRSVDRPSQIPWRSVDRQFQLNFPSERTVDDHTKQENTGSFTGNALRNEPDRALPISNSRHHAQTLSSFDSVHSIGNANLLSELTFGDKQSNEKEDKEEWMTDALLRDVSSVRLSPPRLMERL